MPLYCIRLLRHVETFVHRNHSRLANPPVVTIQDSNPPPTASVSITRCFARFEDIGHSSDARKTLEEYVVGEIEGYVAPEPGAAGSSEGGSSMMMIAVLLVLLAIGAAVMMQ